MDALFSLLSRIDCDKYVDVLNRKDAYGNTVLHYFALSNNKAALKVLIRLGASLNETNHADETPEDVFKCGSLGFVK